MLTSDLWPYVAAKVGEFLLGKLWEFTSGLRCYSCAIPKTRKDTVLRVYTFRLRKPPRGLFFQYLRFLKRVPCCLWYNLRP